MSLRHWVICAFVVMVATSAVAQPPAQLRTDVEAYYLVLVELQAAVLSRDLGEIGRIGNAAVRERTRMELRYGDRLKDVGEVAGPLEVAYTHLQLYGRLVQMRGFQPTPDSDEFIGKGLDAMRKVEAYLRRPSSP